MIYHFHIAMCILVSETPFKTLKITMPLCVKIKRIVLKH